MIGSAPDSVPSTERHSAPGSAACRSCNVSKKACDMGTTLDDVGPCCARCDHSPTEVDSQVDRNWRAYGRRIIEDPAGARRSATVFMALLVFFGVLAGFALGALVAGLAGWRLA